MSRRCYASQSLRRLATPDEEVRDIVAAWAQAYTEGDHNKISQFYDRYARLHGVDTADMIGPEAISEHYYFESWRNTPRSVKLSDITCYSYDDATATCAGGMEFVVTRRSGETVSQPSQVSLAFAYDHDVGRWLIHDHRVLRGIAVAVNACAHTPSRCGATIAKQRSSERSSNPCPMSGAGA